MTKGKSWSTEDEKKLKDWIEMGVSLNSMVFNFEGKYTKNAIYQKMIDMGLEEKEKPTRHTSSIGLKQYLPDELPSVETALKTLTAALKTLETPGLKQEEIHRLKTIINGIKIYKELVADYIDYRSLEAELVEANKQNAELIKKMQITKPK